MKLRALPLAAAQPYALALLRIVAGYMFLLHGTSKVLHFPDTGHAAALNLATLGGWSGILELVGGALAVLYFFVFLFLAAAGGGAWSFDQRRR